MSTFINTLKLNNVPNAGFFATKLMPDDRQYWLLDFALKQTHCSLMNLVHKESFHTSAVVSAIARNEANVQLNSETCSWICYGDPDCKLREIYVLKQLKRLVHISLEKLEGKQFQVFRF